MQSGESGWLLANKSSREISAKLMQFCWLHRRVMNLYTHPFESNMIAFQCKQCSLSFGPLHRRQICLQIIKSMKMFFGYFLVLERLIKFESSALLARPYATLVPIHYIIWSLHHTLWQPHLLPSSFFSPSSVVFVAQSCGTFLISGTIISSSSFLLHETISFFFSFYSTCLVSVFDFALPHQDHLIVIQPLLGCLLVIHLHQASSSILTARDLLVISISLLLMNSNRCSFRNQTRDSPLLVRGDIRLGAGGLERPGPARWPLHPELQLLRWYRHL